MGFHCSAAADECQPAQVVELVEDSKIDLHWALLYWSFGEKGQAFEILPVKGSGFQLLTWG